MAIYITNYECYKDYYKTTFKADEEFFNELNSQFKDDATPSTFFIITEDIFKRVYVNQDINPEFVYKNQHIFEAGHLYDYIVDFIYDYAKGFEHELYNSDWLDQDFGVEITED